MRLDRPVLSLCLGQVLSSAALAAAQDVPTAGSAVSAAHSSNAPSGIRWTGTPSTTNTTSSKAWSPSTGSGDMGDAIFTNSSISGKPTSSSENAMNTIIDAAFNQTNPLNATTSELLSSPVGTPNILATGDSGPAGSKPTSTLFSHFATDNSSSTNSTNSTNPNFGVGINGEGKQAKVDISALPSGLNLSNIGVYGYTTVTLAPTDGFVRPDAGQGPRKEVTVIPLTRPYKLGVTTINGTPTSVIQWLPGVSNLVGANGTLNSSAMLIGDKAPTMQKSVQGLEIPSTSAPPAAPQSDTAPKPTPVPASVVKSSAPPPVASAATSALGNILGQLQNIATSSTQRETTQQPPTAVNPPVQRPVTTLHPPAQQPSATPEAIAQHSEPQPQPQTQPQPQPPPQPQSQPQPQGQPVYLPSADTSTRKAPVVIVDPGNSAVVVSNLPVQSVQPALGNTNPEKVIQPQAIPTVPSLAPIIPQTGFNVQSATAVMQQHAAPVQTSRAAQANPGADREFEVKGNSIVQVNKQPNAAASVLAVAYTQATGSIAGPKAVGVGHAVINIQAVPTGPGSGPREFLVGTQVASLGQTVTEQNTPIVIHTNGAGEPVAMVGTSAAATLLPVSAPVLVAPGAAALVIAGQTLGPAAPVTIGPIQSATVVSLQTGAHGEAEVVAGSSTMPLAVFLSQHTDASLVTSPRSRPTVGPAPVNVLVAGSQTLGVGMPAITIGSSLVSLTTDHDGLAEVVAASTTMPVASFLMANPSFTVEQIGTVRAPVSSGNALAIGSLTLDLNSVMTIGGSVLALTTDAAGLTDIVENGSRTVPLAQFLTENPSASVVVDAPADSGTALTLVGVTVAAVPGATDSAIVIGSKTLEPGQSVTETFGTSATQTFVYTTLADGSLGVVVMDASTTVTRPLPTAFLAGATGSRTVPDALPSKTSASQAGSVPLGSAANSRTRHPVETLFGILTAALSSLLVGVYLV